MLLKELIVASDVNGAVSVLIFMPGPIWILKCLSFFFFLYARKNHATTHMHTNNTTHVTAIPMIIPIDELPWDGGTFGGELSFIFEGGRSGGCN